MASARRRWSLAEGKVQMRGWIVVKPKELAGQSKEIAPDERVTTWFRASLETCHLNVFESCAAAWMATTFINQRTHSTSRCYQSWYGYLWMSWIYWHLAEKWRQGSQRQSAMPFKSCKWTPIKELLTQSSVRSNVSLQSYVTSSWPFSMSIEEWLPRKALWRYVGLPIACVTDLKQASSMHYMIVAMHSTKRMARMHQQHHAQSMSCCNWSSNQGLKRHSCRSRFFYLSHRFVRSDQLNSDFNQSEAIVSTQRGRYTT